MGIIDRLKKRNVINEDGSFNTNREEYSKVNNEDYNVERKEITKNEIPFVGIDKSRIVKPTENETFSHMRRTAKTTIQRIARRETKSLWDEIKERTASIQERTNTNSSNIGTMNTNFNNANISPNLVNSNSRYNRSINDKNVYVKANKIATNEETKDAQEMSAQEIKARKAAEKLNEQIKKGGSDKANAMITNTLTNFQGGVQSGIAGIVNAGAILGAGQIKKYSDVSKKLGITNKEDENFLDKISNKILDESKDMTNTAKTSEFINSNITNNTARTLGGVSNVLGNMAPSIASNILLPGSGLIATGVSAGGNSAQETLNRKKDNIDKAIVTGTLKGLVEAGTEKIAGGNILSKGSLDNIAGKAISTKVKSNVGKFIANKAYQFSGEMLEEQLSDNAGYIIDKVINGKDLPTFKEWWQNANETNKTTFLSTLALNLVGLGGGNVAKEYDKKMQTMVNDVTEIAKNDEVVQKQTKMLQDTMINNAQNKVNNQETLNNKSSLPEQQVNQSENVVAQNENMNNEQIAKNIINSSYLSNNIKQNLLNEINGLDINNEGLEQIKQIVKDNSNLKSDSSYKTDNDRKRTYMKYKNDTSEYDTKALDLALDAVEENRNGKRTVKQWLEVADKLGSQLAEKNNDEIERIAFRSWNDLKPNTKDSITRYDNRTKTNETFKKFTSDDWVNKIYESVNKTRENIWQTLDGKDVSINNRNFNNVQYAKVENNQNSLYNNANESESDLNGQIQRGRMEKLSGQYDTSILEKESSDGRQYTTEEYKKFEQTIRPSEQSNLTEEQKQKMNNYKRQYNKDIVFFDGDENQNYTAGASLTDKGKIYIDRNTAQHYGEDKVINHEIMESDIRHNRKLSDDTIMPAIEKIMNDNKFEEQKNIFWKGQKDKIPSDYAIAKEILCDRFAEMRTGEKWDYNNVLSQETNMTIDFSLNNFHKKLYGKEIENFNKSSINLPENDTNINQLKIDEFPDNDKTKQRKHYDSIIHSQYSSEEARKISKKLMGTDTYVPESNEKQIERADERIKIGGAESELNSLMSRAMTGGNIKADDIAVGERLIQYYSKVGDKVKLQEAIQATAMAGTTAGQTVQAMSLLNHQTPEGQAIWLQRSVEKMNNDLKRARGDKTQQFDLTGEMLDKITNSKNNEELQNNLDEVYKELGQQVSKSTIEKIDSWRYFSMLANPRTHIRNIVGNFAMGKTQNFKNKVAGTIEAIVGKVNPKMERTHTFVPASSEIKDFAKNDIANVADRLGLNENKYNPKSRLQNNMRTFKSDAMENTLGKLFNLNDNALEAEDGWGLKAGYKKALAEYMTANKLTPDNITDAQLSKARNYAVEQAKEATFHQECKLASLINQLSNKNRFAKYTTDAILPFVKTPLNVAKSGLEYNPLGLAKSMIYDTVQLRKGNITVNKYIDNISKGLTGTGISLVGYALADIGILKASGGDDDDKESYDESRGKQTYSIRIGDNTYSLDWLAPTGIPLFVGAEMAEMAQAKKEEKSSSSTDENSRYNKVLESGTNLLNAMTNSMNPMAEMSMLSGLTSALSSYEQGSAQMIANMGTNSVKSYVNQFFPTALGQIAKTTDEYERSTTSTKSGILPKAVDSTKNQIMSKVPGLRQMLPTKTDIWGEDIKQPKNKLQRGLENAILPWTRKSIASTDVDKALNNLYEKTGESSILPDTIDKTLTIDSKKYRLTVDEYSKYKENFGKTSYKMLNNLVKSKEYKKLTDEQKQKSIENIYSYAKECNKVDYAKNNKLEMKQSTMYKTAEAVKKDGGVVNDYFVYIGATDGLDKAKDKMNVLANANYSDKTKSSIYSNTIGKEDDSYNKILKKTNINISEYLKYKQQDFESDKKDDGTLNGKAISNSKKTKVYNYVNNMNINYDSKLLLIGMQYKLTSSEMGKVVKIIDNLPDTTKDEKLKIYDRMQGFKVYKNGTIKW